MADLPDRPDRPSLLPPSEATRRELAIEAADAAIADVDVAAIVRARSVADCSEAVLPSLAWERSVDVWDPTWPVSVKRAVIDAAPEVHRHKGTVYAVKTALSALGIEAQLTEWWQPPAPSEPPRPDRGTPYTFHVAAFASGGLYDGPLIDARLARVVFASIVAAKPATRAFDMTIVGVLRATAALAPVVLARTRYAQAAAPAPIARLDGAMGAAAVTVARSRAAAGVVPHARGYASATLAAGTAAVARTRVALAVVPALPA